MTITREQAITVDYFEHTTLTNADNTPLRCRRMGKTKTWKTRPTEFRIPVKYGMYNSFYISHDNAHKWNTKS